MSRIQTTFEKLKQRGSKALIPFITAGDPDPATTVQLMHALVKAGADILELGVPFSDPMADGPTIQRASERALKQGVTLHGVLDMVAQFRSKDAITPVVLMGYGNPVEAMGWERFATRCAQVGVDGVLTVDFPPEESHEAFGHLHRHGIDPIFLLAPTTSDARIARVAKLARGYVYYVSLKGVTGAGNLDSCMSILLTSLMNAATFAASLIPLADSTPLETSTAYGPTCLIASATLPACKPPDRITGSGKSCGIKFQSNDAPVPPCVPSMNASSSKPCAAL